MSADRAALFLEDILSAPAELAAVLRVQREAIRDLQLGALARPQWRLVGMGSSRFAALDAACRLREARRDAYAEVASASTFSPGGRDTLVIAISASGSTPEVLSAVERHRGTSFVLGLTAAADSPLARHADALVPLVGERAEAAGIASLTYRATVAALVALTGVGEPDDDLAALDASVIALQELVASRHAWLADAADVLEGARDVHVLGDGMGLGTLEQAALMLREGPRLPAMPFDTGDWLHVGLYTLFPGDPVLLYGGAPADDQALRTIRRRGGRVVTVGPVRSEGADADVAIPLPVAAVENRLVRSVVESAVAELLAAELWRRTSAETLGEERVRTS
jgi:glutamine---fructose-6-phosphate transaminase (isomerizing)